MDRYGEELFPHTPVLFVATRETRPAYGTSVFSDTDWNGSVGLALGLQPRTKHVFVVTGASQYDRTSLAGARVQFQALEKRLDFTYLTGLPIVELKRTVATLPPDSIIYFVSMTLDGTGRRFEGTTALEQIAAAANAPTYVQSETDLGRGAIGGHVWSSRPWGLKSAEIVLRLLAGEVPDAIPTSKVEIYRNQLDWRQLQRWKIDESLVPAGAQILFRELSIWDQYGTYIVGTIALVVFQLTLIGRLLVQRAYRRRIEASLRQSEQRFRLTAEQNQELVGRLINAQETERARVARDLHDDVSQQLASLSITLSALKRSVGKPHSQPEIEQTIITLQDRTAAAAESIRTLSHELHPSVLQHAGLVPTLRRHCADVGRQHRLTVTFSADDPPGRLSPDLALCLFRVAQEALANAVRHAQPRTIAVQLLVKNDGIELSVADDGIGFVASGTSMGLGLRSINERVRLMGGASAWTRGPDTERACWCGFRLHTLFLFLNRNRGAELEGHDGLRWNFGRVAAHRRASAAPDQRPHGGA